MYTKCAVYNKLTEVEVEGNKVSVQDHCQCRQKSDESTQDWEHLMGHRGSKSSKLKVTQCGTVLVHGQIIGEVAVVTELASVHKVDNKEGGAVHKQEGCSQ